MGLVQSIQSLNQIAWPGEGIGRASAASKSSAGRPRSSTPPGVETPEEALTYIQQLSQGGRTEELAGLLRSNPVFREAWQTLQQSSSGGSEVDGGVASPFAGATPNSGQAALPVPSSGSVPSDQPQIASQDPNAGQIAATQEFSAQIQAAQTYPVPAPRSSLPLAAGRQVYENQARYFAQEGANFPRISIRI